MRVSVVATMCVLGGLGGCASEIPAFALHDAILQAAKEAHAATGGHAEKLTVELSVAVVASTNVEATRFVALGAEASQESTTTVTVEIGRDDLQAIAGRAGTTAPKALLYNPSSGAVRVAPAD